MLTLQDIKAKEIEPVLTALNLNNENKSSKEIFDRFFIPKKHCDIQAVKNDINEGFTVLETAIRNRESLKTINDIVDGNYNAELGIVDSKIYDYGDVIKHTREFFGAHSNSAHSIDYYIVDMNKAIEYEKESVKGATYYADGKTILENITIGLKYGYSIHGFTRYYCGQKCISRSRLIRIIGKINSISVNTLDTTLIFGVEVTKINHNKRIYYTVKDVEKIQRAIKYRYILKKDILPKNLTSKQTTELYRVIAKCNNPDTVEKHSPYLAKTDIATVQEVLNSFKED